MAPSLRRPDDPAEWMRRARSNLARAKAGPCSREVLYEDLCFDAQQAVEKALKALLVASGMSFPKTHAIMDLLTLIDKRGIPVPKAVRRAGALTGHAVASRYPGVSEDVGPRDYTEAVRLAEKTVAWVESRLSSRGASQA